MHILSSIPTHKTLVHAALDFKMEHQVLHRKGTLDAALQMINTCVAGTSVRMYVRNTLYDPSRTIIGGEKFHMIDDPQTVMEHTAKRSFLSLVQTYSCMQRIPSHKHDSQHVAERCQLWSRLTASCVAVADFQIGTKLWTK